MSSGWRKHIASHNGYRHPRALKSFDRIRAFVVKAPFFNIASIA
jgi:hypothetical protein